MIDVKFGDKVTITQEYRREVKNKTYGTNIGFRFWAVAGIKARKGCVFLGTRTLSNGFLAYDESHYYRAKEHFKCAYISVGSGVNPIYVPLEGLKHE